MRRVLGFLMVLYVTFTVLHPCADALLCTVAENHADAESHEEDACSPFCVCACCGVSFLPQTLIEFFTLSNITSKSAFIYTASFGQNFNPSFRQPPKE
jgi:hypothetical protein